MGVDVRILAQLSEPVTAEAVREWSYRIGDAVGADFFWRDPKVGRHNLCLVSPTEKEYLSEMLPQAAGDILEVSTLHRYYGPGYERGDWPRIAAVLQWLRYNVPGRVYYGGDCDTRCREADGVFIADMWAHWALHGRIPYAYSGPDQQRWGIDAWLAWPTCALCAVPMSRNGFGASYAAFHCAGCGYNTETHNKGVTWSSRVKEM